MTVRNPVSPKVLAAGAGALSGGILTGAVLWALGAYAWHAGHNADQVRAALDAVPAPLAALIGALIGVVLTVAGGYQVTDPLREKGRQAEEVEQQSAPTAPMADPAPEPEPAPPLDTDASTPYVEPDEQLGDEYAEPR